MHYFPLAAPFLLALLFLVGLVIVLIEIGVQISSLADRIRNPKSAIRN